MSLLPKEAPVVEGLEIAGMCASANTVSGDFYDYLSLGNTTLAIVLADVTGKGMKGAMNAVLSYGALHAEAKLGVSPAQVLWTLNRDLHGRFPDRTNCAMCFATLDANVRTLRYANAGIPYPVVWRDGNVLELESNGMPLGGFREAEYQEVTLELKSGDVLAFFSDGITEAPSKDNPGFLYMETDRLRTVISGFDKNMAAQAMIDALLTDVSDFSGDTKSDDMTVVIVKVQ